MHYPRILLFFSLAWLAVATSEVADPVPDPDPSSLVPDVPDTSADLKLGAALDLHKDASSSSDKDVAQAAAKPMPVGHAKPSGTKVGGVQKKKLKKKLKKNSSWLVPLLMVPLVLQAKLIPLLIVKLKFLAVKALVIGKLALILLAFNLFQSFGKGHSAPPPEIHHEQDAILAKEHYGYNGGPEYGAWLNRRQEPQTVQNTPYRAHVPQTTS